MELSSQRLIDMLEWDVPKSRYQLSAALGISDRRLRKMIAEARLIPKDFVIVSSSQGEGYYKTRDINIIRDYVSEMDRRARSTFLAIQQARKCLTRLEDSTAELEEVDDGQNWTRK